jgi:hypothetical protein
VVGSKKRVDPNLNSKKEKFWSSHCAAAHIGTQKRSLGE